MQLPDDTFDVLSVGKIAATIQMTPARIQEVAALLGIAPAGRINGVAYFSSNDVERIAAHVRAVHSPAGSVPREPIN